MDEGQENGFSDSLFLRPGQSGRSPRKCMPAHSPASNAGGLDHLRRVKTTQTPGRLALVEQTKEGMEYVIRLKRSRHPLLNAARVPSETLKRGTLSQKGILAACGTSHVTSSSLVTTGSRSQALAPEPGTLDFGLLLELRSWRYRQLSPTPCPAGVFILTGNVNTLTRRERRSRCVRFHSICPLPGAGHLPSCAAPRKVCNSLG